MKQLIRSTLHKLERHVPERAKLAVRDIYVEGIYYRLFPEARWPILEPHPAAPYRDSSEERSRRAIVCLPVIDWSYRFQRPQHLAARFAARGHRVVYVNTYFDAQPHRHGGTLLDRWSMPLTRNVTGIKFPAKLDLKIYSQELSSENAAVLAGQFDEFAKLLGLDGEITLFVQHPFWTPLAQLLRRRYGAALVYDCMDDHAGFADATETVIRHEKTLAREADLVVVSAQKLLEKMKPLAKRVALAPNACDYAHFADATPHPELASLGKPVIGYFGAIVEWFAADLVAAAARARPDASFVLVGRASPENEKALGSIANVRLLGEKDYAILPRYLAAFDVCLIPFKKNELTLATNPVKLFEYMSAGKPVASTRLPEVERFSEHVHLGDTPEEFVQAIDRALADSRTEERRAVARANGWDARAATIDAAIGETVPRASIVLVTWHQWEYTKACLDSVLAHADPARTEIIVVDNASTDGTRTGLYGYSRTRPNVRVIYNDENRGFAAANNQGLKIATGELLVLLNNDTIVTPGWLRGLARWLEDPSIGLVGPVTNNIGNEARLETSYQDLQGMLEFAKRCREKGPRSFDIRVLAMFCVAMRRDVFEKVGELDERFGMGMFEDDDYARRVRAAGKRLVCAEDVFIHHFGSASFKTLDQEKYKKNFERNRALFEEKWGEPWQPHKYRE